MVSVIRNHQLFSEVYLRELRAAKGPTDDLEAARVTLRDWREVHPSLEAAGELGTYVRRCLSALGVAYAPREEAAGFTLYSDSTREQATGLCLPVPDDDLGRMEKGRHHQARLVRELRAVGLSWGILTNGARWRLVHAGAPAPYEQFLEADLDALLPERSFGEFRIFHRFFCGEAFAVCPPAVPPPPLARVVPVKLGLDAYLAESAHRIEAVEKHLKGRVEKILEMLCRGFLEDEAKGNYTREELDEVYRNGIYLLYRILFLFYAEARELLPLDNPAYRAVSLTALVEKARLRHEGTPDADPHSLWKRLTQLFVMVDDGDESLGVTAYNGGLFDDAEKPYLKSHKITDDFLAPPLYDLAYEEARGGARAVPVPIDYRDLSVRHLGTLYEGMLEYRLNLVRREPVVVRESGGKRTYTPQSQAGAIQRGETLLEIGTVYFADDKGERKASGSYYTPEDVVQYIISNTVLPKLRERRALLEPVLEEAHRARAVAPTPEEQDRIERYADARTLAVVEGEILKLRVLDPAMGSGHFLVAAGQLITDFCVETLNETEWPNPELCTDPLVWKRRVVERCLYGVDKNPLAVELAKLALWITSAGQGKPLTFLNHHLKPGNSLYGTPLSRLGTLPTTRRGKPEGPLFHALRQGIIREALGRMAEITNRDSDTLEAVKSKGAANVSAEAATRRLRDVANVWLGTLFSLTGAGDQPVSQAEYGELLDELTRNYAPSQWEVVVQSRHTLKEGRRLEDAEGFFHWELEFPDAVVDSQCQFDAVVANPPYVGTQPNTAIKTLFETARCNDLYAWIVERALGLVGAYGSIGTIVPLSIVFSGQLRGLREVTLKTKGVVRVASFDATRDGIFPPNGRARNGQRATIIDIQRSESDLRIEATDLTRWIGFERPYLLSGLRYTDITCLAKPDRFPKIGSPLLAKFMELLLTQENRLEGICSKMLSESQKDYESPYFLIVPRGVRYFISAFPSHIYKSGVLTLTFKNQKLRDLAGVLLNSNVFYWYWCAFGDGFHMNVDLAARFPVPSLPDERVNDLAERLWSKSRDCQIAGRDGSISTYNFNRMIDILLDIDELIIETVAPDLTLSRDIFAQYKSNSFLRPFDLSTLATVDISEDDE